MLDCEFTIVDGPFVKRKLWERFVLAGTTDGHAKAAEISRGKLRAILESARGIKPDDVSPQARAARTVKLAEFDGMRFIGKIGIEKGKDKGNGAGSYPDLEINGELLWLTRKNRGFRERMRPTWHWTPQNIRRCT
jgi:hypothetical protein